jgi:hypothetical protein
VEHSKRGKTALKRRNTSIQALGIFSVEGKVKMKRSGELDD